MSECKAITGLADWRAVECPTCFAKKGSDCAEIEGWPRFAIHIKRVQAAEFACRNTAEVPAPVSVPYDMVQVAGTFTSESMPSYHPIPPESPMGSFNAIWDDVQSHYLQYLDTRKDPPEFYKACAHVAHRLTLAKHSFLANVRGGIELSHSCQHEATEFLERAASDDAEAYDACHSKIAEWLKAESRSGVPPESGEAKDRSQWVGGGHVAAEKACMTALGCLFIACDEHVARDVQSKVLAYIEELKASTHPPAGAGAFEELYSYAKAIDDADRKGEKQQEWNLRMWRSVATPSMILKLLASRTQQPDGEGWISVEDRMPELPAGNDHSRAINVLVAWKGCTQPTEMAYAAYPGARSARGQAPRWEWQGRIAPWAITHWRPLPSTPAQEPSK